MNFERPANGGDPQSTMELWHGAQQVGTIYCLADGLNIVFEDAWEPAMPEVEPHLPVSIRIPMTRDGRIKTGGRFKRR